MKNQINSLVKLCHEDSSDSGWWDGVDKEDLNVKATKICLMHSELSEAMEGIRKGLMDDKLPHRKMEEVELADAVIRIFDYAGAYGLDIGGAIQEKMEYNKIRKDHKLENRQKQGGKKF
jgi:NTP pyrophosphatase (non-canonical NTP hydrolase)